MPAKGKHRRTRAMRLTRTIAVAGTGGAALALPLMGAAAANAAPAHSVSEQAVQSVPASAKKAAAKKNTDSRTYTVKSGDYLSKIADEQDVDGGWKKLYADNREAVGSDPSLIHPGLKLSIDGQAAKPSAPSSAQSQKPAQKSAEKPAEKTAAKPAQKSTDAEKASSSDTGSQSTGTTSGYTSPVAGGTVGTPYHQSGSMWSSGYHTGTDFVVPTGTSLKAVGAGTVVSAGWGGAYGNQVVIRMHDGTYTQYGHLSSIGVSVGQSVEPGQQIGVSGATGNVTGPHLHFEARTSPEYGSDMDPVAYLRSHGVNV